MLFQDGESNVKGPSDILHQEQEHNLSRISQNRSIGECSSVRMETPQKNEVLVGLEERIEEEAQEVVQEQGQEENKEEVTKNGEEHIQEEVLDEVMDDGQEQVYQVYEDAHEEV